MMDRKIMEKLQQWEAHENPMAPLSSSQSDTVHELASLVSDRPIPDDLPLDDVMTFTPHPVHHDKLTEENLEDLCKSLAELKSSDSKMETGQQFLLYYATVEEEMALEEEQVYWSCIRTLEEQRSQCNHLLEQVETSLQYLDNLTTHYNLVAQKTTSLHDACEHLLSNQTKLNNVAETMGSKLTYFEELDRLSNRLHSPTFSVLNESFIPTLAKLDECIAHMTTNASYKESGSYLVKYQQCLSRALGMIKSYVNNSLQSVTLGILSRLGSESGTNPTFTLFYGRFRTNATRIKTLMNEMETRAEKSSEYDQLLTEVHQCYFRQRDMLVAPSVNTAINEMAQKNKRDHCALVRSGCAFLIRVCEDEHQLFYQFFTMHTPLLTSFLEGLCITLYDVLRPIFVHIIHLETLAELCSILRNEVLEEHSSMAGPAQSSVGAFDSVTMQMLQDVQERLVYRAGIYIRTDILQYQPAPGDLQYPEKLQMMESIAESLAAASHTLARSESKESLVSIGSVTSQEVASITGAHRKHSGSVADIHGLWYPPVRRTLVCLSKLYRCLDRAIFQGLSQEALSMCVQALKSAAETIQKNKTILDGQLFEIKHLLILREQIAPFQADFSVRETSLDFSSVRSAAWGLLSKRDQLFTLNSNNALLEFFIDGTPQVHEQTIDSKREVDSRLKHVCEAFITHVVQKLAGPMKGFLTKVEVIEGMAEKVNLRSQPWTGPDRVREVVAESHRELKKALPPLLKSMQLYLSSRDTQLILFRPIRGQIQGYWQSVETLSKKYYTEEEQLIIACPHHDQISLFISETVA